jgi:hypothetical protein
MSLTVLQMVERALRMHGAIADGETPSPSIGADMLVDANAMKRAWFGTLIGPRMSAQVFAPGFSGQAENGGEYAVPGGEAFTVTAPLNPKAGARFGVLDGSLGFGAFPCTVSGNGRLIAPSGGTGAAGATTTLAANGQNARWWYRGDTGTWTLEQDWALLSSAIEFPDPIIAYMPYMLAVEIAPEFGADVTPEMAQGAMEGRQVMARSYARRGVAGLDPVIGLQAAAPPQPQGR